MTRRRRQLVAGGLVAVLAVGGSVAWWASQPSELARVRVELDAADPGWTFADIRAARLADQPPPAENAVLTAVAARALIPRDFTDWPMANVGADMLPRQPINRFAPATTTVAAWRASAEAVTAARRAADQPRGMAVVTIPADPYMTLLPHVDDSRRVADLLRVDAVLAATHGDPAGAAVSLRAILSIARGAGREPFLVSHLVASAIRQLAATALVQTLAVAELPADGLADVEAELRAASDPGTWAIALRDWRGTTDLELTAVAAGAVDIRTAAAMAGNSLRPPPSMIGRLGYRLKSVGHDHAALLTYLTAALEVARRPSHEWTAAIDAVPLPPDDARHLFAHTEAVTAKRMFAGQLRSLAVLRTAAVAAGCERFRLRHGRWPTALAELPPADHSDPYTGGPLRLKRLADGLVVYSVGPDGRDNGGKLSAVTSAPTGTDIGCRLWDLAARR